MHDRLKALVWRTLLQVVGSAPRPVGRRIGAAVGRLVAHLPTRATRTTARNVELCFATLSPDERKALVRASLQETGKLAMESARLWTRDASRWSTWVASVRGAERIEEPLASGRGVLVLVPHFGNWELLNCLLGERFHATVLYEPVSNAYLQRWIDRARGWAGSEPVPTTLAGLKTVSRRLRTGGVVGLLPDQVPPRASGIHARFFGVPALTMTLAHRLLRRSGASAVLASAARNADGDFDISFDPIDESIYARDVRTATVALNAAIERGVRRAPAQYQWEYKRFKRQPPGTAPFY